MRLSFSTVDMINIMSYDYHGSYDGFVGHASSLYPSSKDVTITAKGLNVVSIRKIKKSFLFGHSF